MVKGNDKSLSEDNMFLSDYEYKSNDFHTVLYAAAVIYDFPVRQGLDG